MQEIAKLGKKSVQRFLSVDPVNKPWESPYTTFNNNPILKVDPLGLDSEDPGKHKVQKNETLTSIAKRYYTTVDNILKLNKIKNKNKILPGQTLNVPQFYNGNDIDNKTGLKNEVLKYIDFSGNDIKLGFKKDEVNNFDYDVQVSDRERSPMGSGIATVLSRLGNFTEGTGYTNMVFGPETEFAKSAQNHYSIEKARTFFYNKYKYLFNGAETKEEKMGAGNAFLNLAIHGQAQATNIQGKWGVSDIGKTGWGKNSWGMQYTGSCAINVFSSKDANRLIFVVANSTSLWSAGYHITPNISRNKEVGGSRGSTILNLIVWDEVIDYSRFKK
ncbi:MAG: LysM peptidoglycan-binding domain-containing protein [Chitinophagaceae bacterium]|nr:LysM peptidoglycan-binding domain-containing protein [Chitinophagaceae bacterium]